MRHRHDREMKGKPVYDAQGEKIGTVSDVYVDEHTHKPRWILVDTGLFSSAALIPFAEITARSETIVVPFLKERVKSAPYMGMSEELDADQERALYEHYGLSDRAA